MSEELKARLTAWTKYRRERLSEKADPHVLYAIEQAFIAAWNTRAPQAATQQATDGLREAEALRDALWDDMTGRRGFRMDQAGVDEATEKEWRDKWLGIIKIALSAHPAPKADRTGWLTEEQVHSAIWDLLPGLTKDSPEAAHLFTLERMALAAIRQQKGE